MKTTEPVRVALVGCGGMARAHLRGMLRQQDTTQIAVLCEPAPEAYAATAELFIAEGLEPPPNQPDLQRLLAGSSSPRRMCTTTIRPKRAWRPGSTSCSRNRW
jgi:ornithine cyclodeaminase/alanine dehydrogenase-like protein (mu-crystallin family)